MTFREKISCPLSGQISLVGTPFDREGDIDLPTLKICAEFTVTEVKTEAILLIYVDSLYSFLPDQEIAEFTRITVEQTARRQLVVAAGSWWTGESVLFAEYCRWLGAEVFMPLPPNSAGSCTEQNLASLRNWAAPSSAR